MNRVVTGPKINQPQRAEVDGAAQYSVPEAVVPPPVDRARVEKFANSLHTSHHAFEKLSGVSAKDLEIPKPEEPTDIQALRDVIRVTQEIMNRMNQRCPGIPPDSVETTLNLVQRKGSHTILLHGIDPEHEEAGKQVIGYGVVITGQENFPDRENIPPHLLTDPNASRVIRLFVTEKARELLPRGEAFSRIVNDIKEIAKGGPCIGMVLTGITFVDGELKPGESVDTWLEAKKALEVRGFEDSGLAIAEEFTSIEGRKVVVGFRWYVWPPMTEAGEQAFKAHTRRFMSLERRIQERTAWLAPALPLNDGIIACFGTYADLFDVAHLYLGDTVLGVPIQHPQRKVRIEGSPNLVTVPNGSKFKFASNSLEAIVAYGVLPDIAGKSGDKTAVKSFILQCAENLRDGGMMVLRDTVAPSRDVDVMLDLSNFGEYSAAKYFRDFIEHPSERHIHEAAWGSVQRLPSLAPGMDRFCAPLSLVTEFLLKLPYVKDWDFERERSYTLYSREDIMELFAGAGLRVVHSGPEHSAWLRENFYRGQVAIHDLNCKELELPPTNFIVIVQKVRSAKNGGVGEGIVLRAETERKIDSTKFLRIRNYEQIDPKTGAPLEGRDREVVERPNLTHDVIPYALDREKLFVRARLYPRPITTTHKDTLDGTLTSGYLIEQISAMVAPASLISEQSLAMSAKEVIETRSGVPQSVIEAIDPPTRYFSRPDTIDEEVVAQTVRLRVEIPDVKITENLSGFSVSGETRMLDGRHVLRSCQVGGNQDARMERKLYELFMRFKLDPGPWLSEPLKLTLQGDVALPLGKIASVIVPERRAPFRALYTKRVGFLDIWSAQFAEYDNTGKQLEQSDGRNLITREYVRPAASKNLSLNTVSVIPVAAVADASGKPEIYAGVYVEDFPVVQEHTGSSRLATIPTFRVPNGIQTMLEARRYTVERLERDIGLKVLGFSALGGKYFTSPGVTAEVIYPMVAEVNAAAVNNSDLIWIPLRELRDNAASLGCAQLITSSYRAAHALGV